MLKATIEIFTDFLGHSYKERLSGFGYEGKFPLIQPTHLSWVLDDGKELGRKGVVQIFQAGKIACEKAQL